jgi:hypothetical protein
MIRRLLWGGAIVAASTPLLVCSPVDRAGTTVPGQCQDEPPLILPQTTDILFVVDNSGSMREEQQAVAQELAAFVDELQKGGGITQDFQVGVITTGVYQHAFIPPPTGGVDLKYYPDQGGRLRGVPSALPDGGLGPPTAEKILSGTDPLLVQKFARLVQQGTGGSGQETPFEAVRLATSAPLADAENAGFLRDGARLVVVIVTDEDDCSEVARPPTVVIGTSPDTNYCRDQEGKLTPVDEYYRIFTELADSTGKKREVVWAAIAPVSRSTKEAAEVVDNGVLRNVDCPSSFQPGFRHRAMAARFNGQLGNLDSICNPSYQQSLIDIAAIANITTSIAVRGIPDPGLLAVEITRQDGMVTTCTVSNPDAQIRYDPPVGGNDGRIHFLGSCPRLPTDLKVEVKLLCAG